MASEDDLTKRRRLPVRPTRWAALLAVLAVVVVVGVSIAPLLKLREARTATRVAATERAAAGHLQATVELIISVQSERGRSAIYAGADGPAADAQESLDNARTVTDQAVTTWQEQASAADLLTSVTGTAVDDLLTELPVQRVAVDERSTPLTVQFAWYTTLVEQLESSLVDAMPSFAAADTATQAASLLPLVQGFEELGQERGRLGGRLSQGSAASRAAAAEVLASRAARAQAQETFVALASPEQAAQVVAATGSRAADAVATVENAVLAADTETLASITASSWFADATVLLTRYSELATGIAGALAADADARLAASRSAERQDTLLSWLFPLGGLLVSGLFLLAASGQVRSSVDRSVLTGRRASHNREELLSAVLNNSQSMIYVKDLAGRYLELNQALLRVLGRDREEVIGQDDWSIDPTLAPIWRANDQRAQFEEILAEETLVLPGGTRHFRSVKFPLRDTDGQVYATGGVSIDVTTQQEAVRRMEEAVQAMAEAGAAKTAFLATMSHEIRTPLNAVIGMADLLTTTSMTTQQEEFVDTIRASGTVLMAAINDILDYARFESGDFDLRMGAVRVADLVDETLGIVALRAGNLDLVADVHPDVPAVVVSDGEKLRRVLVHLAGNGVKFTRTGDVLISVRLAPTRADLPRATATEPIVAPQDAPVLVTFAVQDTGIGIAEAQMGRLFRPFSQVDSSSTRQFDGSGLGLAISQAIVRALGGEITATSVPGSGSTFRFTLPLRRAHVDTGPPEPVRRPDLSGVRALVVDDNDTNRRILCEQMTRWGMQVQDFADPVQALVALGESGPHTDLAVLDHHMGDLDGIGLARKIRLLPATQHLPVLLLTNQTDALPAALPDDDLVTARATKPVRAGVLRTLITEILADVIGPDRPEPPALASGRHRPAGELVTGPSPISSAVVEQSGRSADPVHPADPDGPAGPDAPDRSTGERTRVTGQAPPGSTGPQTVPDLPDLPDLDPLDTRGAGGGLMSLRILLAEDNRANQKVASGMVAALGHRLTVVDDGRAALGEALSAELAGTPFDVVLMDIHMPVLDGLAATRAIRGSLSRQPYVIAMTAGADRTHEEQARSVGMDAFLIKPVRIVELRQALVSAVAHLDTAAPVTAEPHLPAGEQDQQAVPGEPGEPGEPEEPRNKPRTLHVPTPRTAAESLLGFGGPDGSGHRPDLPDLPPDLQQIPDHLPDHLLQEVLDQFPPTDLADLAQPADVAEMGGVTERQADRPADGPVESDTAQAPAAGPVPNTPEGPEEPMDFSTDATTDVPDSIARSAEATAADRSAEPTAPQASAGRPTEGTRSPHSAAPSHSPTDPPNTPPTGPVDDVVDDAVLSVFLSEIGQDTAEGREAIIAAYREQADEWVQSLSVVTAEGDRVLVRELVHTLLSPTKMLGGLELVRALEDLGSRARGGGSQAEMSTSAQEVMLAYDRMLERLEGGPGSVLPGLHPHQNDGQNDGRNDHAGGYQDEDADRAAPGSRQTP